MKPAIAYGEYQIEGVEGGMRITHQDGRSVDFSFSDDDAFLCLLKALQRFNTARGDLDIKSPIRLVDLHWIQPLLNQKEVA